MNRRTAHRVDWVEALENRRMFCASHHALVPVPLAMQVPLQGAPQIATPSILGTFIGTGTDSNERSPGTVTAVIETQTARGKITGLVESKYPRENTHVTDFTGIIRGDSVTITTGTTTVSVVVSDDGRILTGTYVYKGAGDSSTGRFVVTRPSKR